MTRFFSEALGSHDRSAFASGNDRIDSYYRQTVSQDIKRNYAACYVLIEKETNRTAGFYTLSAYTIPLAEIAEDAARKLPRYPNIPAVLIGWLGRDTAFRAQGVGGLLLLDAITRLAASPVGAHALCAHAIDEEAALFYEQYQFVRFQSRPQDLYLPFATARKLLGGVETAA